MEVEIEGVNDRLGRSSVAVTLYVPIVRLRSVGRIDNSMVPLCAVLNCHDMLVVRRDLVVRRAPKCR